MSDLNNTTITGRLVRAPLLRNGRTGKLVAFFTIAANQRYQDKSGNKQEETAFVSSLPTEIVVEAKVGGFKSVTLK